MRNKSSREIIEFADELKNILDNKNSYVHREFDDETIDYMKQAQLIFKITGQLAKEIEWLHDGAIKPATFKNRMKEIEKGIDTKLASITK